MIDWAKPIEMMDGTPLMLSNADDWGGNPDSSGDYWVCREDGREISGFPNVCVRPDTGSSMFVTLRNTPEPDTVTIKRMTEAEARDWVVSKTFGLSISDGVNCLDSLGLIREETREERFTRETGHSVTDAVRAALDWGR